MKKLERRVVRSAVQQKRCKRTHRWKRWRRNRNRVYNHRSRDTQPKSSSGITVGSERQNVAFPVDSRLIENLEEVLGAFDKVRHSLDSRRKIYVDLSGVEDISMSTILYLINLFDRAKSRRNLDVKGNLPASKKREIYLSRVVFIDMSRLAPGLPCRARLTRRCFQYVTAAQEITNCLLTFVSLLRLSLSIPMINGNLPLPFITLYWRRCRMLPIMHIRATAQKTAGGRVQYAAKEFWRYAYWIMVDQFQLQFAEGCKSLKSQITM